MNSGKDEEDRLRFKLGCASNYPLGYRAGVSVTCAPHSKSNTLVKDHLSHHL